MVTRDRGGQLRRLVQIDRLIHEQATMAGIALELGCCERTVRRGIAVLRRELGVVVLSSGGRLRYADGQGVFTQAARRADDGR